MDQSLENKEDAVTLPSLNIREQFLRVSAEQTVALSHRIMTFSTSSEYFFLTA
jgi:hypothetical protein